MKVQLEEINPKIFVKEGWLKRYSDRSSKINNSKITKENSTYKSVGNEWMIANQQLGAKEEKQFWSQTWERKEQKTKCIYNVEKELQSLEEGLEVDIHLDLFRATLRKVLNSKTIMAYMDTGSEVIPIPSIIDWLYNCVNV